VISPLLPWWAGIIGWCGGTTRDGERWIWGGVWTLPADTDPRIGLISHGKQTDAETATSEFDYFRVYRP
jgi:arabinan endo-1,5-alpha-L-arabinosidase